MSAYAIIHDHAGNVRCCTANGSGGAPYPDVKKATTAIRRADPHGTIRICNHPHDTTKPGTDSGYRPCARTDKPCAIRWPRPRPPRNLHDPR